MLIVQIQFSFEYFDHKNHLSVTFKRGFHFFLENVHHLIVIALKQRACCVHFHFYPGSDAAINEIGDFWEVIVRKRIVADFDGCYHVAKLRNSVVDVVTDCKSAPTGLQIHDGKLRYKSAPTRLH